MKQITDKVFQIGLGPVNVFLIEDNGLTLVDTGFSGSTERIFSAIKKGSRKPENIKRIILTHAHPDHSGSAAVIAKKLNVPVWAHFEDAAILEQGIGGRNPKILAPGLLNWFLYTIFIKSGKITVDPITFEKTLADNDILNIAGGIRVIHIPGHSLGQIALLLESENILIAADLCSNFFGLGQSTVNEDPALGIESIGKISEFDFDKAVFGHGSALMKDANKTFRKFYEKLIKS